MNHSHILSGLLVALTTLAMTSCKNESAKPKGTPPDRHKAAKSFIVRVENDASGNKSNIELMSSNEDLKDANASKVESAYNAGKPLTLAEQNKGLMATDAAGNSFALNGCQGYNMPMGYYQYPYSGMPIGNVYNQGTVMGGAMNGGMFGGGFGQFFGQILGGLLGMNTMNQGQGGLPGLEQILVSALSGGNFMPIGLPYGQNGFQYGCGYQNPYVQNYPYPQNYPQPQYNPQPYPQNGQGYGPMPYPYMGQYQQGPYTYYTYGQQPGYQPTMQPIPYGAPQQPPQMQPQQPSPYTYSNQQSPYTYGNQPSPYTYQPYPTTYNNGYAGP